MIKLSTRNAIRPSITPTSIHNTFQTSSTLSPIIPQWNTHMTHPKTNEQRISMVRTIIKNVSIFSESVKNGTKNPPMKRYGPTPIPISQLLK